MKNILITFATQLEVIHLDWPDVSCGYLRTGVGKMRSAYYLSQAIDQIGPDMVINIGTAGSVNHRVGDLFVCRHFIDRDMQKLTEFGIPYQLSFPEDKFDFLPHCLYTHPGVCNTGDSFVTELSDLHGDIIDMEAYAQAFVCENKKIPFLAVKCVSDIIGENSVETWEKRCAFCIGELKRFLHTEE